MTVAISIEGLGKKYLLAHRAAAPYSSLRDAVAQGTSNLVRRLLRTSGVKHPREEFWALRDLNLQIREGDRVGILGRNGAGKSTLLKLLARIAEPSEGTIRLRGRVASMLEVGTGFHLELTGRENIFLNGAILGMGRAEIARKFDEIVAFADVERFLDTPVKHFSSGMALRLAFAVAAHIEPDVLIVDEVLAVGDVQFQKKCMGKMAEAGREGRTVLFVSHNMSAIGVLCTRAIVLDKGRLLGDGTVKDQVELYLGAAQRAEVSLRAPVDLGRIRLERLELSPNPVESCAGLRFVVELRAPGAPAEVEAVTLFFTAALGGRAAVIDLRRTEPYRLTATASTRLTGTVASMPLVEGDYEVGIYFKAGGEELVRNDVVTLRVAPRPLPGAIVPYPASARGLVELDVGFTCQEAPEAPLKA